MQKNAAFTGIPCNHCGSLNTLKVNENLIQCQDCKKTSNVQTS